MFVSCPAQGLELNPDSSEKAVQALHTEPLSSPGGLLRNANALTNCRLSFSWKSLENMAEKNNNKSNQTNSKCSPDAE